VQMADRLRLGVEQYLAFEDHELLLEGVPDVEQVCIRNVETVTQQTAS
jgi:hypothetical protein